MDIWDWLGNILDKMASLVKTLERNALRSETFRLSQCLLGLSFGVVGSILCIYWQRVITVHKVQRDVDCSTQVLQSGCLVFGSFTLKEFDASKVTKIIPG